MNSSLKGWYEAPLWAKKSLGAMTILALAFWTLGSMPFVANAAVVPATNPSLGNSCGLDVALVLDSSGSVSAAELTQMKTAFHSFVNALNPATPTWFSVTEFDTTAHVSQAFTSTASLVNTAIDTAASGGSTNWEDGLIKAQGTFDPRGGSANVIVFASDGQPNRIGTSGTTAATAAAVDAAVTRANIIKGQGTRIITLGIGITAAGVTNMKAISSEDAYYDAASFAGLASALQTIATDLCGGTITAHKVIDADGNLESTGDQTPGEGWSMTVASSEQTTDAQGSTQSVNVNLGTYSVSETQQAGYTLVGGSCTGATNNGSLNGTVISGIEVGNADIVSCTFYNTPNAGTLHVVKHVVGGDKTADQFTLHVSGGSTPASFAGSESGVDVSVPAGASYAVTEDADSGYSMSQEGTCSGTMAPGGSATCTVTNTVVNPTEGTLTVIKEVVNDHGGQKVVSDFPLFVNDVSVTSGVSNQYAEGTYTVTETGDAGYAATYSGACDSTGHVTIVAGNSYTCTITNDDKPAILHVVKNLVNGGEDLPSLFSFQINGGVAQIFENDGQNDYVNLARGTYSMNELPDNSENYTVGYSNCSEVTIGNGEEATCTITNTHKVPPAQCSDGLDNDSDEKVDAADPGCHTDGDVTNESSYDPNDNDETDPVVTPPAQCSDGIDNGDDEDTLVDQADPGCHTDGNASNSESYDPNDNDETNTTSHQCSDGLDNDHDNLIDTADAGCHSDGNSVDPSTYVPNDDDELNSSGGPSGGGGGSFGGGPIQGGGSNGGGSIIAPQVLGASCGLYMDKHLRQGSPKNDKTQVTKLQEFLNKYGFGKFTPTGTFGPMTLAAVNAFQTKYSDDILKPWNISGPTGLVYLSTLRKINLIECPELSLQLPPLVEWSKNPKPQ